MAYAHSEPIEGGLGVYVFVVEKFTEAPTPENYTANQNLLKTAFGRKVSANALYRALEKAADLEDNRVLFY